MKNVLFIFGFGYCAEYIARKIHDIYEIYGTSRTIRTFPNVGIVNFNELDILPTNITHIVCSIPPNEKGDPAINKYIEQIKRLPNLKSIVYLSSTAVYADAKGEWVDESYNVYASNNIAKARLAAERQFESLAKDDRAVTVLRLSGIYGPNRNQCAQLRAGTLRVIDKKDQIFSRVHVEDVASAVELALVRTGGLEVFNLADDYPCNPLEVALYAAELTKLPMPDIVPYEPDVLSEMGKIFYSQSKRIKNDKAKRVLGWNLKYPSYREGLINCNI